MEIFFEITFNKILSKSYFNGLCDEKWQKMLILSILYSQFLEIICPKAQLKGFLINIW